MGLLRMAARTAVVAGTATAVSGRVARRQGARYDQKAEAQQYEQQQYAQQPQQYAQQPQQYQPQPHQYAQQPQQYQPQPQQYEQQQYAQQPQQYSSQPAAPAAASDDTVAKLQQLAQLHEQGVLSDAEFSAAKAKMLGL
jgi:Short C-terminal domain